MQSRQGKTCWFAFCPGVHNRERGSGRGAPPPWPWLPGNLGTHPGFVPTPLPRVTSPAGLPLRGGMVTIPSHPAKS